MSRAVLDTLETYYDLVPRAFARTEEVGPFTLFVSTQEGGHGYYARPRLGSRLGSDAYDVTEVTACRTRQRELGVPEALEWVHQTTPALLEPARTAGFEVERCPLLVLDEAQTEDHGVRTRVIGPEDDDVSTVTAAVHAGFGGTDEPPALSAAQVDAARSRLRSGHSVLVGAYDERGHVVGGGSHSPRGRVSELMGIAVLPRARRRGVAAALTAALVADARGREVDTVFLSAQDDAVARVYERVGFVRVGTACIAEPSATP